MTPKQAEAAAFQDLVKKLSDRRWRLDNLYFIKDKDGNKIKFLMNEAQENFYNNMWFFNCLLKARQMGLSTFIEIFGLDYVLWNSNKAFAIIAHTKDDAEKLFKSKIKFAYDNLPSQVKAMVSAQQDREGILRFSNGSSIEVGTSHRGGTFQLLHVSEYGKIAAKYPEKAREIKSGAFNTIAPGNFIFVESTAEGQEGEFYDLCQQSQKLQEMGAKLTSLDPKFFFYPWFKDPSYTLEGSQGVFPYDLKQYFDKIESETGVTLTLGQKYWYQKKKESMGELMLREFPSTPKEAFETSTEGTYYNGQLAYLRKANHIREVPWISKSPVHTFWDLGVNDYTSIVFMQHINDEYRIIDYYENQGEGLQHYANHLRSLPYVYGDHYFPHDTEVVELGTGKSRASTARSMGINPLKIVPRTQSIADDIQTVRNILPQCWFDVNNCDKLLKHLGNYKKEWNDRLGVWKDRPRHDEASHGADAFRYMAVGYKPRVVEKRERRPVTSWEDA